MLQFSIGKERVGKFQTEATKEHLQLHLQRDLVLVKTNGCMVDGMEHSEEIGKLSALGLPASS
jgi:hypothetical protein